MDVVKSSTEETQNLSAPADTTPAKDEAIGSAQVHEIKVQGLGLLV